MPEFRFERERNGRVFVDAVILTDDEAAALTPEQIEAIKDARFEAWYAAVTAPSEE